MSRDIVETASQALYILSEDFDVLLRRWVRSRFGCELLLDFDPFRARLRDILRFGGHELVCLPFEELRAGMLGLLERETRPVMSKDPVYAPSEYMLQVTRCCDLERKSVLGLRARYGYPAVAEQIQALADRLGATLEHPVSVVVLDDVIFTGGGMVEIARMGAEVGLLVEHVIAGIAIAELCARPLSDLGITMSAVHQFPGENESCRVVDEICSRDFFVFAPMTGRTLADPLRNAGFSYLEPFGDAARWASFGKCSARVSRDLLVLNIDLLAAIEKELGTSVCFGHLDREPLGVRFLDMGSERVLTHLRRHLHNVS